MEKGEIILYQPNETIRLEVRLEEESVWLTQAQMAELFQTTPQNITIHIRSIYKEGELEYSSTCKEHLQVRKEGNRTVQRKQKFYNLDVIISVGYRVKSFYGTRFRQWANQVLKDYLLKGYSINHRLQALERTVAEHSQKKDFFVRTALPPIEGVFYNGQIFDAYKFATDLIKSAKHSLVLIDNYVDETTLLMLSKRNEGVSATIYTAKISQQLQLDIEKHNDQYPPIQIRTYKESHDRFLLIDGKEVYHIGASLKDLGKKMFAFSKMNESAGLFLKLLEKIL
jgi:hypothetical protein